MQVFGHFLNHFILYDHETWFADILGVLSGMYRYGFRRPYFGPFRTPNRAIIRSKVRLISSIQRFSNGLTCVEYGPPGAIFLGYFILRIEPKVRVESQYFVYFADDFL